jgi:hypothetical protein
VPSVRGAGEVPRGVAATVRCHVIEQTAGDLAICVVVYRHPMHVVVRATLTFGHHAYASTTSRAGKRANLVPRIKHRLQHGRYTLTLQLPDHSTQVIALTISCIRSLV